MILIITAIITAFFLLSSSSLQATQNSSCIRVCGTQDNSTHTHVQYPFGFSPGCEIRLACSGNFNVQIGEFHVQNITNDHILVNIPAKCDRNISTMRQLHGTNYAPTSRNNFLLQNCSKPVTGCLMIEPDLLEDRFEVQGCQSGIRSCYLEKNRSVEFTSIGMLEGTGCSTLFTSIAFENRSVNSSVELDIETVELGWLLKGTCKCVAQADCTNLTLGELQGFRCRCKTGFQGDGFVDGDGCRKVGDCSASRYMSGRCGGTTKVGVLIGGIAAGAGLVAALALIYYCIRKRTSHLKNHLSAKRLINEATGSSTVPLFPYKDVEKATHGFSEKHRLGTGAYGTVYAGKLHNDEWVAIKKLRRRDADGIDQIMNEIKLLSSVSHQNLVRLLGCCIEKGEQILVYEYMPNGTLAQHLQGERGKGLPWTVRLTIATETAHAIAHLHTATHPPIYHRDIKSSNILLDVNFNSKVADFGLSRLGMTDDSHISTAPQGTPGYVDPQYHQNFHLSDKSDVYSFGVVLVEIITAMKVVDFTRPPTEINLASVAIDKIGKGRVDDMIDPFLEPNRDAWTLSSIHKVAELAFRCLAFHKDMRPSMTEVAEELEHVRLSGWAPLDENIGMGSSVSSSCASPFNGSEQSVGITNIKKAGIGSRRVIVTQREVACLSTMEEVSDSSPVSVHDPWLSQQSSPSTNSLLGNITR
ncbi:Wall-associated receptor kinase-like 14 [Heracleum sosnowskyi]|uniref:Wall-associated receptor kinase-like 14 n=1 Tax=Heracleum sosnowskyi TaxID=360622 RepID=A0AAD8MNP3_9APIA|nr:Wall-associated receptor kinase-like 14 [Heracleum sosnowskyi]